MATEPRFTDTAAMRAALGEVLHVPAAEIEGAIIITAMSDGTYLLLHSATSTAVACEIARQVFAAKPHYHDQVIDFVL